MQRSCAVVLGSIALALVTLKGVLRSEPPADVLAKGILAMMAFLVVGAFAGWVIDHLVQVALETRFRRRLSEYQKQLEPDGRGAGEPATE